LPFSKKVLYNNNKGILKDRNMKKLVVLIAALMIAGMCSCYAVQKVKVSPQVYSGISLYKQQNYTGAAQLFKEAAAKNPKDILAQYYLAISYVQLGMRAEASAAFGEVIANDTEGGGLAKISQQALDCYSDSNKCASAKDETSEFIKSGEFMYKDVKSKIQEQQLKSIMNTINRGEKDVDFSNYKLINDASSEMPTNEEIANAVKVLSKVGFNPYAQNVMNPAIYNTQMSPQLMQLQTLTGQANNNTNSYMNLLPYMMAQGASTEGYSKMDPQLIQTMMMSQMIPNFGFDDNTRNY